MDLSKILSVSGKSGLYEMEAQRKDGVIVAPLGERSKIFLSSRQHMFTPLENITIYTTGEGMELKEVFQRMKKNEAEAPPVDAKSDGATLREYFSKIVPEHDEDQVYTSDIKKIIKWYQILDEHGMIKLEEESSEAPKEQPTENNEDNTPESDQD